MTFKFIPICWIPYLNSTAQTHWQFLSQVERTEYEGAYREGSGSEELGAFPPPPPPPDGKNCFCDKEYCCNLVSDDEKAAGRHYRGEKGERGPRVSHIVSLLMLRSFVCKLLKMQSHLMAKYTICIFIGRVVMTSFTSSKMFVYTG